MEHGHLHRNSWLPLVKSPQVLQTPWLELSGNLLINRLIPIDSVMENKIAPLSSDSTFNNLSGFKFFMDINFFIFSKQYKIAAT